MTFRQRLFGGGSLPAATLALALAGAVLAPAPAALAAEAAQTAAGTIAAAHLPEPLVRTAPTTEAEDAALAQALSAYQQHAQAADLSALAGFVAQHPHSGWTAAVLTNLGLIYLHDGYFSRATAAWRQAWALGRDATDPHARATVDRAVGELARLHAALGQYDQLTSLFADVGARRVTASATEFVQQAKEQLSLADKGLLHVFSCGPVALKQLILSVDPDDKKSARLEFTKVGAQGTNLSELATLAQQSGFVYRLVKRMPGQAVPVPAVVHWKSGHFSAIVGQANGRYHLKDLSFPGGELWVTQAALDEEASGYFLVPASASQTAGWAAVSAKEAAGVWGRGQTSGVPAGDAGDSGVHGGKGGKGGPNGRGAGSPGQQGGCPMCAYDIKQATVGVTLSDVPVGYVPPIGPAARVRIVYNQREDSQPANFNFYNVGQKWSLDWQTYVVDDPTNPGANVSRYLPGGGAYYYSGYASGTHRFASQSDDGSVLVLASQSPVTYQRLLADGGIEVYAQADGATSYPRKVFLSQIIDPQGQKLTLNYDAQMRLTSLTDATGRQTTFRYGSPYSSYLVTQITDPFGRSATLTYDNQSRLTSITDILGLTSRFSYDANSLVNAMTTPYGTTDFAYTAPGTSGPPRYVDVTDPLGYHERVEWLEPAPSSIPDSDPAASVPKGLPLNPTNQYLTYRDSFYWNKDAYVAAGCSPSGGCDYTKARDTHFLHVGNLKSSTIESIKNPLENRIWYQYPGQTSSIYTGSYAQPIAMARVLDDGTTQLTQYAYDTGGFFNLKQTTDPLGRVTTYTYANQIDLAAVSQTTAFGLQTTLAQFTYNSHHRPVFATDAAGQTTTYAYNAAQQVTAVTNPLGQTTSYQYNPTGDLASVTNANGQTAAAYTYDAFDRVASYTDSEDWSVSYSYDAANRPTKATYPDGTTETYSYDKLDLASYTDRLGRTWRYSHDADRRLTAVTDPTGQQTQFGYNGQGQLTSRTDPNSHITQWAYDIEGRPTTKTYGDNSTLTYGYETTTSRLKSVTDALGQVKRYAYAQDDRLTGISYQNAVNPTPNVSFAYDAWFPRLVSRTDGEGTTQFAYGPAGSPGALQLQQETTPLANGAVTYAYDALGRISSRTVQGQGSETFAYDALGRLSGHASDLGAFSLGYLGQTGQITSRQLSGSNLATTWSYLPNAGDRRLASISTAGLSAGQSSTFQYTSNAAGETTGVTQTSDAPISNPPGSLTQTASYNNLNQLTALSGQSLTYDADGNLLSDGARTYSWDAENRLVGIGYPGQPGKATAFAYDGLGRRIAASSTPAGGGAAATTSYIWCGDAPCQARDATGAVTRGYYAEGESAAGAAAYYAPDRLGSVRRVFTAGQAPTYDYDAYGAPLQATAPLTDFGYAGLIYNADSGLNLAVHRVYDPTSGRWLSRDPIGEAGDPNGNLYGYVGGEPLGARDPLGLAVQVAWGFGGAIIAPGFGASGSGAVGLNLDGWNSGIYFQGQAAGGTEAGGAFVGYGESFSVGGGPDPSTGVAKSKYAEADAGLGPASVSGSVSSDNCHHLSGQGAGGARGGPAAGLGAFVGTSYSGTLALPTIGQIAQFLGLR
jgi:RHS repeat-associated protein